MENCDWVLWFFGNPVAIFQMFICHFPQGFQGQIRLKNVKRFEVRVDLQA